MRNEFPELCVFCHHQSTYFLYRTWCGVCQLGYLFKCTCCYFDSSLKIWMVIWDIFHVSVELPHCFRIKTPFRFYCNMPFSFVIIFCFPMIFFSISSSYSFLYFSTTFANSNFSSFLYTAFAPRLKFISVYTVFLCNTKRADIKQRISSKTEFRLYYSILAYLYTDLYKIIIS